MAHRDQEIEDIGREIKLLREAFSKRLHNLEQRLQSLADVTQTNAPVEQISNITADSTKTGTLQIPQVQINIEQKPQQYASQEDRQYRVTTLTDKPATPATPAENTFSPLLRDGLGTLLSPFGKALSPLINWYQHCQTKGQGPIFIFMLVGIALLVCGFAYLTQLLVGELGAGSKSLLLFIVSISVTYGGHKLARQKTFEDLGSATISLGLLLNFVTIYMAGSYYHLLADWLVLFAYVLIGLSGFILANWHSTKVVSALAIIGGATIPLISLLDSSGTTFYLCGLAILAIGSFYQANTKAWLWLSFVTVTVCSASLEYLLLFGDSPQVMGLFSQLFYCLYFAVMWQELKQSTPPNTQFTNSRIIFISLALFSSIGLLYQSDFSAWFLPLIALFNALLSAGARFKAAQMPDMTKSLYAMVSSVWLLVAIFSSLAADYWGIAVGLEGLFLLYFALQNRDKNLQIEAYALIIFAILHALFAIAPYFPSPAFLNIKGLMVFCSIGILLLTSRKLLQHAPLTQTETQFKWEFNLSYSLRQFESLWLAIFVIATAWVYLANWCFVVFIPLQLILLYKSQRQQCQASETLVFFSGLIMGLIVLLAALQVQSFSFRDLPSYAQTALALLFIELWALCEFYRRIGQSGTMAEFAESLRLIAYLLCPILFIPSVVKHYGEFLSLALWLSSVIAYTLARIVKHPMIRTEALYLSLIAACYCVLNALINQSFFNLTINLSLVLGLVYFGFFLRLVSQRHRPMLEQQIASIGMYFGVAVLFKLTMAIINIYLAAAITVVFAFTLLCLQTRHPTIKRNLNSLQTLLYLNIPLSWFCLTFSTHDDLVSASVWLGSNLLILLSQLIADRNKSALQLKLINQTQKRYLCHHLLVTFSLIFLLADWQLSLLIAPWLILQGSYLFFAQKQSPLVSKFALGFVFSGLLKLGLIDAANALLWQKVALLLGIGVFMIISAFFYQRRINNHKIN
ncbi:DUF2339 domain-containing protein [Paraglaciecola hydrolytica]|uniref:DUF2339 domain-containing protein n=1 Tax=Paraglaciecola hydrolytica TaxID=1799789 RepID=A0A148KMT4_9ALTE|nr:DUF2339 domain-containing protein [Paraglaciecola hydrolytica]KXI27633.1 hypothetical protein AX660_18920 [Paraglaciecola hydrolytica]